MRHQGSGELTLTRGSCCFFTRWKKALSLRPGIRSQRRFPKAGSFFGGELPFPGEFKILVSSDGHDVAGALALLFVNSAVFDNPAIFGESVLFVAAPAFDLFAIEEELPALFLFLGGKSVVPGRGLERCKG